VGHNFKIGGGERFPAMKVNGGRLESVSFDG
jgi:hypothetical protein